MDHLRPEKESIVPFIFEILGKEKSMKITLAAKFLITSVDCKSSSYGGGMIDEYPSEK
jgi:hypothetical protein